MNLNLKYYLTTIFALYLVIHQVSGQTQSCTEILNAAQNAYDEGRTHEITENFWGDCLQGENLNTEERVQAYRLMTLVWLQLDEPDQAYESILKLLDTNPEYQINRAIDPTEFINLYKTIRTDPIMRIGVRGGGNYSMLFAQDFSENTQGNQEYRPRSILTFGYQVGASVEIDMLEKLFILNPEVYFSNYSTDTRYNSNVIKNGVSRASMSNISVNVLGHYSFYKVGNFEFLASAGIGGNYILSKSGLITIEQIPIEGATPNIESPTLNYSGNIKDINAYAIGGGAIRFKIGRPYITADIRYQFGFLNVAGEEKYPNIENSFNYLGMDFITQSTLQNIIFNLGIQFPIFKHERLIQE